MKHWPNLLPGMALIIMGILAGLLIFFPVPAENKEILIFVSGALSGALTMGGAAKIADKISTTNGDNTTVQPEAQG